MHLFFLEEFQLILIAIQKLIGCMKNMQRNAFSNRIHQQLKPLPFTNRYCKLYIPID